MSYSRCRHENRPHRRPPPRLIDVVAAVGIAVGGLSVISGIVVASPRWQRIIASWRESFATRSASVPPVVGPLTETGSPAVSDAAVAVQPQVILPSGLEVQPATAGPVPPRPPRAQDPMRPVDRAPIRAPSDSTQVMANLLVSQLGQDPAWRMALANADAHSADSPEHVYWRRVAAAIRDGGQRARQ
jgi:hypothetical protein